MDQPPILSSKLELSRCPHCRVARPNLTMTWQGESYSHTGKNRRSQKATRSQSGLTRTSRNSRNRTLNQALESLHAPAGAVMLCASAIDAMLKAKGYKEGKLYIRINKAAEDHLITAEMAAWAHDVRLDANEPRHADEGAPLPDESDAKRCLEFTFALAEFLFVLPAQIERGRKEAAESTQ